MNALPAQQFAAVHCLCSTKQLVECKEKGIGASCDRAHDDMISGNLSCESLLGGDLWRPSVSSSGELASLNEFDEDPAASSTSLRRLEIFLGS